MWGLFRKTAARERVWGMLAKEIQKILVRLATVLSERERRLSVRQKKIALCIFCIGMSFLSTWWVYEGMMPGGLEKRTFLRHQSIEVPPLVVLRDSLSDSLKR